jgi:hypothetical protein
VDPRADALLQRDAFAVLDLPEVADMKVGHAFQRTADRGPLVAARSGGSRVVRRQRLLQGRSIANHRRSYTMQGIIRRNLIAVAGALMLLGAVHATSASAAVSGLEKVRAISVIDSSSSKTATAYCPAGKRVIGGGGGLVWDLQHHTRDVVLTSLLPVHPLSGPDSYQVTAHEDQGGTTDTWWAESYAICADPIAGMHTVATGGTFGSAPSQTPQAHCNAGERVLGTAGKKTLSGGGAIAFNAPGNAMLTHIILAGAGLSNEALAVAAENVPTAANWDFIVGQAICAS